MIQINTCAPCCSPAEPAGIKIICTGLILNMSPSQCTWLNPPVPVAIDLADSAGNTSGFCNFARFYVRGANPTFTAPSVANDFAGWRITIRDLNNEGTPGYDYPKTIIRPGTDQNTQLRPMTVGIPGETVFIPGVGVRTTKIQLEIVCLIKFGFSNSAQACTNCSGTPCLPCQQVIGDAPRMTTPCSQFTMRCNPGPHGITFAEQCAGAPSQNCHCDGSFAGFRRFGLQPTGYSAVGGFDPHGSYDFWPGHYKGEYDITKAYKAGDIIKTGTATGRDVYVMFVVDYDIGSGNPPYWAVGHQTGVIPYEIARFPAKVTWYQDRRFSKWTEKTEWDFSIGEALQFPDVIAFDTVPTIRPVTGTIETVYNYNSETCRSEVEPETLQLVDGMKIATKNQTVAIVEGVPEVIPIMLETDAPGLSWLLRYPMYYYPESRVYSETFPPGWLPADWFPGFHFKYPPNSAGYVTGASRLFAFRVDLISFNQTDTVYVWQYDIVVIHGPEYSLRTKIGTVTHTCTLGDEVFAPAP